MLCSVVSVLCAVMAINAAQQAEVDRLVQVPFWVPLLHEMG
jgi:hypothetical protein